MKKGIPPAALAVIAVVVIGVLVMLGMNAGNGGGPNPTPADTQDMNNFRDANAAKTGGTIDENTGQVNQSADTRTSEQIAREGGN